MCQYIPKPYILIVAPISVIIFVIYICHSQADISAWSSFWGSYLGGLFGGIATLFGVVSTIKNSERETARKENKERSDEIRRSAIIVYYDFDFALGNINSFLNEYKSANKKITSAEELNVDAFNRCKSNLDQFYFDSEWIKTVASLLESEHLNPEVIKNIYALYGNLMTINKFLSKTSQSDDREVCSNAYHAMQEFQKNLTDLRVVQPAICSDKAEMCNILSALQNAAGIEKEKQQSQTR